MKTLNSYSLKIMKKILAKLGDKTHIKIANNENFMPLIIEKIGNCNGYENTFSLAHYGEQNGDLMRDPEMLFVEEADSYAPIYFRNDYAGFEEDAMLYDQDGNIAGIDEKSQADMASFAETWLRNIQDQQEL